MSLLKHLILCTIVTILLLCFLFTYFFSTAPSASPFSLTYYSNNNNDPTVVSSTLTCPPSSSSLSSEHINNKDSNNNKKQMRREETSSKKKPKIIIYSYSDSAAISGYLYAAMLRLCYARKFDYKIIIYNDNDVQPWFAKFEAMYRAGQVHLEPGMQPQDEAKYWAKMYLMKKTLLEHTTSQKDWVLYVDSDTVITQPNLSFEEILLRALKQWKGAKNKRRALKLRQRWLHRRLHDYMAIQRTLKQERINNNHNSNNKSTDNDTTNNRSSTRSGSSRRDISPVTVQNLPDGKKLLQKITFFEGKVYSISIDAVPDITIHPRSRTNNSSSSSSSSDNVNNNNNPHAASLLDSDILPDIFISNSVNMVNNGVFAMRNTIWSHDFLKSWENDVSRSSLYHDNGPFLHALLRAQASSRLIQYDDECSVKSMMSKLRRNKEDEIIQSSKNNNTERDARLAKEIDRAKIEKIARHYKSFLTCYQDYLYFRLINHDLEDPDKMLTRCPLTDFLDNQTAVAQKLEEAQLNAAMAGRFKEEESFNNNGGKNTSSSRMNYGQYVQGGPGPKQQQQSSSQPSASVAIDRMMNSDNNMSAVVIISEGENNGSSTIDLVVENNNSANNSNHSSSKRKSFTESEKRNYVELNSFFRTVYEHYGTALTTNHDRNKSNNKQERVSSPNKSILPRSKGFRTEQELEISESDGETMMMSKSYAGFAFKYGWIRNDDAHIFGDCRMNNGVGGLWMPSASWRKDDSWMVHFAGWSPKIRNQMMTSLISRMRKWMEPSCF